MKKPPAKKDQPTSKSNKSAAKPKMSAAKTVDSYLADVPLEARRALTRLRKTIRAAAPRATERVSYGMPGFYLDGHPLVYFAAFKAHLSFFPGSSRTMKEFSAEVKKFSASKGTLHFTPDEPLPAALVTALVKARVAENEARFPPKR